MTTFRSVLYAFLVGTFLALAARDAPGHPSSGIVVDAQGQVYYQDATGRAIWRIDSQGRLSKYLDRMGGHWMALDMEGHFARAKIPHFERITPDGVKPALVVADGGSPIVVNLDSNLYYLCGFSRTAPTDPGGPLIGRMSPAGKLTVLAPGLKDTVEKLGGITGLAAGPDGFLYAACPSALLKIATDGTATVLVHPVAVADFDEDFPDGNPNFPLPALRGLAVDAGGTMYVAATGCHRVVRIARDGRVEVILKAERPWSPTGVALHEGDVYVLEYTNANSGSADGWAPRVRKLARGGTVTTLATVSTRSGP
jgi:sugar lactone lactonase YvrE